MTDEERSKDGAAADGGSPQGDSIERLLRLAGPRQAIPGDVRERVYAAAKKEWRGAAARRRGLRWGVPLALAASVLLALALGDRLSRTESRPVATVVMAEGDVQTQGLRLAPGDPVRGGDTISTGRYGVALAFGNGLSVRLAANTTATIDAIDEVSVASGRIYADTGAAIRDERRITVRTDLGSATDHGTQFAVGYADGAMTVAVREGSVQVAARQGAYTADAGERLTLRPGRDVVHEQLPAFDPAWAWAAALAPTFDIDGRAVADFLGWAARETGRELVFADDSARLAARATYLRGSVSGLTPSEAIEAIRPTIPRFDLRIDDRRMIVRLAQ